MKRPAQNRPVALAGMRRAVADFLEAAGLSASSPELRDTPNRVTEAWVEGFINGYRLDPEETLGKRYPIPRGRRRELVVVTGLRFHSVCPHHLLPWEGVAHLGYVPGNEVVGFGRLSALLDCFAHRLVLQEDLARQVAGALQKILRAQGAVCVLEGRQTCLALRGACQDRARTHTEAYEGVLRRDGPLRRELWHRIEAHPGGHT